MTEPRSQGDPDFGSVSVERIDLKHSQTTPRGFLNMVPKRGIDWSIAIGEYQIAVFASGHDELPADTNIRVFEPHQCRDHEPLGSRNLLIELIVQFVILSKKIKPNRDVRLGVELLLTFVGFRVLDFKRAILHGLVDSVQPESSEENCKLNSGTNQTAQQILLEEFTELHGNSFVVG